MHILGKVIDLLQNLIYSVNAVVPLFVLCLIGALLRKFGKVNDSFTEVADWIVFNIALPVMIFNEVASCSISEALDVSLIVFLVVSVTACFIAVSLLSLVFVRDKSKRGAFIQGSCRSNFAVLGVPLAVNMFGDAGRQAIAFAMPFIILMFNAYSVIILSIFSNSDDHKLNGKSILTTVKNVITKPLIIGALLGVAVMLSGWDMPSAADKTLTHLSNLATPLALISLGAGFKFESIKGRAGHAIAASLCKTVVLPVIMVTVAALLGFRGPSLGVIFICFGSPTAVSSYIMSKKMKNDHELASQIFLLSTVMCIVTIFGGIFVLKTLAVI
jgi:predicted permease